MAIGFPPDPIYPLGIDSDRTLYKVYNTTEAILAADNPAWAAEIQIYPVADDAAEIWANNGFGNIAGELFYYDSVDKNSAGKIYKLKRCARNLGGNNTQFNAAGTYVRSFVVAEHHNQLVDVILLAENFVGVVPCDRTKPETLSTRICTLQDVPTCPSDFDCPDVTFNLDLSESDPCEGKIATFSVDINGPYNFFKIDFGDGNSTTSVQAGTHTYSPNATIDPVVIVSNDKCQIIQTPVNRIEAKEPVIPTINPPFEIPIGEFPEFPNINIPEIAVPSTTLTLPPFVEPCINLAPTGPIIVPSVIEISPPIPSVIVITPIELPSIIEFINVPTFSPIAFGPAPTFSPISFDIAVDASFSPIDFGPAPSFAPIDFGPGPTFSPISFGPAPTFSPIGFGPSPSFSPISFGPAPSFSPVSFGPAPTFSPISFGPAPTFAPIDFGPAPTFSPIEFGPAPEFSPIDFGPAPTFAPIDFGPAPTFAPIAFGPAPTFSPIGFGPAPTFSPIGFGPAPTFSPIGFGPAPSFAPVSFGPAPSFSPVGFGPAPSFAPISFGPAPTFNPIEFGAAPAIDPIGFDSPPTFDPIGFDSPPTITASLEIGNAPTISVNWGTPPTCSATITIECPGGGGGGAFAAAANVRKGLADFASSNVATIDLEYNTIGIPSEIKVIPPASDIKVIHDIPDKILVESPNIPDIRIIGPDIPIPTEIKLVTESIIPSEIRLYAENIPDRIYVDASSIPSIIQILSPDIPETIKLDVSDLPTELKVVGFPESIELKGPESIPLSLPDGFAIPLKFEGSIPLRFDFKDLNEKPDEDQPCFTLVPCPRK